MPAEKKGNGNNKNGKDKPQEEAVPASTKEVAILSTGETAKSKHLQRIMRHIRGVQDSCSVLAEEMIEQGESDFARLLIANGQMHDNSKFKGIEWQFLVTDPEDEDKMNLAMLQHVMTNAHHPEYWGGIKHVPRIHIAEMICDWHARSNEFGTDLRVWVKDIACKRYDITTSTKAYKTIKEFLDLLLDKPFR